MTHVTAWPTVEWLTQTCAIGSGPVRRAADRPAVSRRAAAGAPALFMAEAQRRLPHLTDITASTWCATPLGEQCVDVCMRIGTRRVGIQFTRRYEMESRQIDALCLVYGRFDVIFRVDADAAPRQIQAALEALTVDCPRPVRGVSRMRLCCASDWVPHFEQVLAAC